MTELKIGNKVKDRYCLKEYIGSGSFGEVWLAHDEVLDCDIAIKIYVSLDPRGVEEFKSEYITTQGVSHPNLLTTTYFDVWEQHPFLIMKYCANGSSATLVGKMDEYALWRFIHDVAAGLKHLHAMPEPIIHQDIKPDNILVDEDNKYLITDFGISKKIRSTMRKQSQRAVGAGATAYMGPERFGSDPNPVKASDIWSLGASIYELATGELPFSGLGGSMQKSGAEMPVLDNKWSKEMNMIIQSCLAKETWDRPTAQQLEEYSEAILKGTPATVTWNMPAEKDEPAEENIEPDSSYWADESVSRSNRRRIWIVVAAIVAAVAILILIWPSDSTDESIVIPEDTIETTDTVAVDTVSTKQVPIPEVKPKSAESEAAAAPAPIQEQGKNEQGKKEEPKAKPETVASDNNASELKTALSKGDYAQVQKLANHGYSAAYGPLAKYYLSNRDYSSAETYAKKAKAAGYSDGAAVLNTLENLGYYD